MSAPAKPSPTSADSTTPASSTSSTDAAQVLSWQKRLNEDCIRNLERQRQQHLAEQDKKA